MADVIHMPCGCPYPGLGDTVPCPHGNYPPAAWIIDDPTTTSQDGDDD